MTELEKIEIEFLPQETNDTISIRVIKTETYRVLMKHRMNLIKVISKGYKKCYIKTNERKELEAMYPEGGCMLSCAMCMDAPRPGLKEPFCKDCRKRINNYPKKVK